ncbi:MAG: ABC transporter permease, partial [Verrucomicrobia bacterium]|nr:ABC transporter permease [Verrucomicrobiota bacterium]
MTTSGEFIFLRSLPPVAFALPFCILAHDHLLELETFATFSCILVMVSWVFSALCLTIGASTKSPRTASAVAVIFMVISLLFGGLLVNRRDAPEYYSWAFYAFPL